MAVPDVRLNNGAAIPRLGLGLWLNKNEETCKAAVKHALESGYRHFDTAQIYANEAFLGAALKEAKIPRQDVFITTKIWNENLWWDGFDPSFDESLEKLQTDYVDLLLIHFPVTNQRRPAWYKMEEKFKKGQAKAIGVSNYTVTHLEELLRECSVKPSVNQVELHVFLQQPDLVEYCRQHDIVVEAYSPLAHGYHMDDPILRQVANKHSKTTAQIMIRWCLEQGLVVLPKSANKDRIAENIDVFDFSLDQEDMVKLKTLDRNFRTAWDPTHVT
ncbi:MAG TPA: aldo/keto reductase [Candidatus Limnocylindrales bacterium]|nr:aldo/keto reductase [Candidatus Limnocylindrales bacterium]